MKTIKGFVCNIKKNKVYLTFFKDRMGKKTLGYLHRRYRFKNNTYFGYWEIDEDGSLDGYNVEDDGMDYTEYIRDFLDYDFSNVKISEFNNLGEAPEYLHKYLLTMKLKR